MPWKQPAEPEYVPDEFPKALYKPDGTPVTYPDGHPKQGLAVVVDSAEEEKQFAKAVPKKPAKAKDD